MLNTSYPLNNPAFCKKDSVDYDAVMYEISSCGKKYYVSESELQDYVSYNSSLFTNVLYIEEY